MDFKKNTMAVTFKIEISEESKRVLEEHGQRGDRMVGELKTAVKRALTEVENWLKIKYLRGGSHLEKRDGQPPLAVRSGALIGSIEHKMDGPLSGWVGSEGKPATKYAKMLLGDQTTTIRPVKAKHLWVPVAKNLTAGGQTRISPTAFFEIDKKKRSIFRSKSGNLVAGTTGDIPGVKNKKFKLLFVLKDEVEVKGTDALAKAMEDKRSDIARLLQAAVNLGLDGGDN